MCVSEMMEAMIDAPRPGVEAAGRRTPAAAAAAGVGGGGNASNGAPGCSAGDDGDGWFRTRDGHILRYDAARWSVPTSLQMVHIPVADLPGAAPVLAAGFRSYMASRLEVAEPASVRQDHSAMRSLLRLTAVPANRALHVLDLHTVLEYEAMVIRRQPDLWRSLRTLLGRLRRSHSSVLAEDLRSYCGRLCSRMPPRQSPVRLRCPRRGALDAFEFAEVARRLSVAVAEGRLAPDDLALCTLIMTLGARVSQCALAKVGHLGRVDEHGRRRLQLTLMKRQSDPARNVMFNWTLGLRLSSLMADQADRARVVARSRGYDEEAAALFPLYRVRVAAEGRGVGRWAGHAASGTLAGRFSKAMKSLAIVSPRIGEPLKASPIRGRRTFATRLRQAGCSDAQIAFLLGHSGVMAVDAYAEPSREAASKAAEAMSREFSAIAAALRGTGSKPGIRGRR